MEIHLLATNVMIIDRQAILLQKITPNKEANFLKSCRMLYQRRMVNEMWRDITIYCPKMNRRIIFNNCMNCEYNAEYQESNARIDCRMMDGGKE